jgi:hypothetical protein
MAVFLYFGFPDMLLSPLPFGVWVRPHEVSPVSQGYHARPLPSVAISRVVTRRTFCAIVLLCPDFINGFAVSTGQDSGPGSPVSPPDEAD